MLHTALEGILEVRRQMSAEIVTLRVEARHHKKACEGIRWLSKMKLSSRNDSGSTEAIEQRANARKADWSVA